MWIVHILLINLLIVFISEVSLGIILGSRHPRDIITVILINIITNPAVVLSSMCLRLFLTKWQYIGLFALEIMVFLVEGFAFLKFKTFGEKNPYVVSFVLNLTSFIVGGLIEILL